MSRRAHASSERERLARHKSEHSGQARAPEEGLDRILRDDPSQVQSQITTQNVLSLQQHSGNQATARFLQRVLGDSLALVDAVEERDAPGGASVAVAAPPSVSNAETTSAGIGAQRELDDDSSVTLSSNDHDAETASPDPVAVTQRDLDGAIVVQRNGGGGGTATPTVSSTALRIANGHAYNKHVIHQGEFPEVRDVQSFAQIIDNVIRTGTRRSLSNGRTAYYDGSTNTLVIVNPHAADLGTCFRPTAGVSYVNSLT